MGKLVGCAVGDEVGLLVGDGVGDNVKGLMVLKRTSINPTPFGGNSVPIVDIPRTGMEPVGLQLVTKETNVQGYPQRTCFCGVIFGIGSTGVESAQNHLVAVNFGETWVGTKRARMQKYQISGRRVYKKTTHPYSTRRAFAPRYPRTPMMSPFRIVASP